MEASSDEEVQEAAMQVLRNIYGSAAKEPVACAVSRWGGDPYSRGQIPPPPHPTLSHVDQSINMFRVLGGNCDLTDKKFSSVTSYSEFVSPSATIV